VGVIGVGVGTRMDVGGCGGDAEGGWRLVKSFGYLVVRVLYGNAGNVRVGYVYVQSMSISGYLM
jgi:hypothetical protein